MTENELLAVVWRIARPESERESLLGLPNLNLCDGAGSQLRLYQAAMRHSLGMRTVFLHWTLTPYGCVASWHMSATT